MILKPFSKIVYIDKKSHMGLIDTGAEVSLINHVNVPKISIKKVIENNLKILSATGNLIEIMVYVSNLKIMIDNKVYFINAYITKTQPEITLLGANFLQKNLNLLKVNNGIVK
ncbi:hypothetical protein COBT_003642 [Conglomerata obtusa]